MKMTSYDEMPKDWALCFSENCPQAERCLRHASHVELPRRMKTHQCVLPQACSEDGHCPMFVTREATAVARGMRGLLCGVRREAEALVRADLIALFGNRRRYYRFREGLYPIGSRMQADIAAVLRKHGCTTAPRFDQVEQKVFFPSHTDEAGQPDDETCDTDVTSE